MNPKLLERKSKCRLYKTSILLAVLYGVESWSRVMKKCGVFESKIPRKNILQDLIINIVKIIKTNRLRRAGHVVRRSK